MGYLERLRAICDRHGLLLIFDEVITGFGRTGAAFAADTFKVQPDLMTVAKGITGGMVPMGAVLVDRKIYAACVTAPEKPEQAVEFFTATPILVILWPVPRGWPPWRCIGRRGSLSGRLPLPRFLLRRCTASKDIPTS